MFVFFGCYRSGSRIAVPSVVNNRKRQIKVKTTTTTRIKSRISLALLVRQVAPPVFRWRQRSPRRVRVPSPSRWSLWTSWSWHLVVYLLSQPPSINLWPWCPVTVPVRPVWAVLITARPSGPQPYPITCPVWATTWTRPTRHACRGTPQGTAMACTPVTGTRERAVPPQGGTPESPVQPVRTMVTPHTTVTPPWTTSPRCPASREWRAVWTRWVQVYPASARTVITAWRVQWATWVQVHTWEPPVKWGPTVP